MRMGVSKYLTTRDRLGRVSLNERGLRHWAAANALEMS